MKPAPGFATNERLKKADIEAVNKYGVGAGAVRTINGTMDIHSELEKSLPSLSTLKVPLLSSPALTATWEQFQLSWIRMMQYCPMNESCINSLTAVRDYQDSITPESSIQTWMI